MHQLQELQPEMFETELDKSWGLKGKDSNLPNTTLPSNMTFLA